jgi:hypothetical protein
MALQKTIQTKFKIPATYWRIIKITEDFSNYRSKVYLGGYIDQDNRRLNAEPLEVKLFIFNEMDVIRPEAYDLIKGTSEFYDAIDILEEETDIWSEE